MVRLVTNVVLTGIAVALLGILVLLSTSVDESARRRADLNLRQLREIGGAVERDDGQARRECLVSDDRRPFEQRREDEHVRQGQVIGHRRVTDATQ